LGATPRWIESEPEEGGFSNYFVTPSELLQFLGV